MNKFITLLRKTAEQITQSPALRLQDLKRSRNIEIPETPHCPRSDRIVKSTEYYRRVLYRAERDASLAQSLVALFDDYRDVKVPGD